MEITSYRFIRYPRLLKELARVLRPPPPPAVDGTTCTTTAGAAVSATAGATAAAATVDGTDGGGGGVGSGSRCVVGGVGGGGSGDSDGGAAAHAPAGGFCSAEREIDNIHVIVAGDAAAAANDGTGVSGTAGGGGAGGGVGGSGSGSGSRCVVGGGEDKRENVAAARATSPQLRGGRAVLMSALRKILRRVRVFSWCFLPSNQPLFSLSLLYVVRKQNLRCYSIRPRRCRRDDNCQKKSSALEYIRLSLAQ